MSARSRFIGSCAATAESVASTGWKTAQENARRKKCRAPGNHAKSLEVRDEVIRLLREEQWSPKQISAVLRRQDMRISHETTYRLIRKDKRDGGDLYKNCRHRLKHRARPVGGCLSSIPNRVGIDKRPPEADGKRFGNFEMDTIVGKGNHGAIVTITKRSTGMLLMRKLNKGKNARELAKTVIRLLRSYKGYIKTITTDNGKEFSCHEIIAQALAQLYTSLTLTRHGKKEE